LIHRRKRWVVFVSHHKKNLTYLPAKYSSGGFLGQDNGTTFVCKILVFDGKDKNSIFAGWMRINTLMRRTFCNTRRNSIHP